MIVSCLAPRRGKGAARHVSRSPEARRVRERGAVRVRGRQPAADATLVIVYTLNSIRATKRAVAIQNLWIGCL